LKKSSLNFTTTLLSWHKKDNKREMPWKGEKDPYKIWLSEIILQQTRVEQGLSYYNKFIQHYPNINKLANAKDEEVFKLWEGLGYYSRCKNLLFTAREIAKKYSGIFPKDYNEIIQLKGIGKYTASAICSFAFNQPYAVVDGNVFRVLSRVYGIELAIDTNEGKKYFEQLAEELLDKKQPALYNQAIMDFGATICKPKLPECVACVFNKNCIAYQENKISILPIKEKKLIQQTRWFYYFVFSYNNQVLIRKRITKDIWQNLHEFYLIESNVEEKLNDKKIKTKLKHLVKDSDLENISISEMQEQKLTHRIIKGNFIEIKLLNKIEFENYFWVDKNEIRKYSFPKFINSFLETTNH
jgi:A/G-specific adenine glycosylase